MRTCLLSICVILCIMQSCKETNENPAFSVVPHITIESVDFYKSEYGNDTIKITLHYLDGDNDIGVAEDEDTNYLYELFYIKTDEDGDILKFDASFDTYDPCNYAYLNSGVYYTINGEQLRLNQRDTVAIQRNKFAYNIYSEILVKSINSKSYKTFSLPTFCDNSFKFRIPRIDQFPLKSNSTVNNINIHPITIWEGRITYSILSHSFSNFVKRDSIKLRVQLFDRGFHESNAVETEPIYIR